MSKYKRIIIFLVLLMSLAGFSFGEAFYSFTNGIFRLDEIFPNESFGRDHNGISFNFSVTYFPDKSFMGFFTQTSLGLISSGYEWDNYNLRALSNRSFDFRFFAAPSFKVQLGEKLRIPISLGPVIKIFREEGWSSLSDDDNFYEALGMGAFVDGALIFNPSRWFFFRQGVTVGGDFLHIERGKMGSDLRETSGPRFGIRKYGAFYGLIYFGIGIRVQ